MGFGDRWIRWIKFCISTMKYSVIVNRGPVGIFSLLGKESNKETPSSFLIILGKEGMSKMLEKAVQKQWIKGFSVGTSPGASVIVSHLLYVDDKLIFYEAPSTQMLYLNITLLLFEAVSGLHANVLKSIINLVNNVANIEVL